MRTVGYEWSEAEVVDGLGPGRISPTYGLLDASGSGLVEFLGEVGITASNDSASTWQEIVDAAGHQPLVMGGRSWCHWTGVRISAATFGRPDVEAIALANPAPGWMGVGQTMSRVQFEPLGSFSAVWFTSW
jgi:hypothetical protein